MAATAVAERTQTVRERAQRTTIAAFLLAVALGGLSPVFVRVTLREMSPMWSGFVRFGTAAVILIAIVLMRGIALPRGRALVGTVLFGALGMGLSTTLIYRGLVDTPAGVSQVILALVPLATLIVAVGVRLEKFRLEGLVGAAIAVVGVGVVFGDQLNANVPITGLLSILGACLSIAATTVTLKWFPATHPLAAAAVALPIGALIFIVASTVFGEAHTFPTSPNVWAALAWLTIVGTLGVMSLFLFVITKLSASASSYQFLLMPLVTVVASAIVTGEQISPAFLLGAAVVLAGVYVGIVRSARRGAAPVMPAPVE